MLRYAWWLALVLLPNAAPAQPAGGFRHVIVVVQENRTPDNLFGSDTTFEPGVDIARSGVNSAGASILLRPTPLAGCYDISHTHSAFMAMFDGGRMDGADREPVHGTCQIPNNPQFKFVDNSDGAIKPYFEIAKNYGFASRMFQTQQGPSFPAHQFLFGGTSAIAANTRMFAADNPQGNHQGVGCIAAPSQHVPFIDAMGVENKRGTYPCFDRPTMAELLDAKNLSWTYYMNVEQSRAGISALWDAPAAIRNICKANGQGKGGYCAGSEYLAHVSSIQAQILTDIANCALPAISWIIPDAADSDHAGVNAGTGPSWVAAIVDAVGSRAACAGESYWKDTAILITWDDWGGWYDHVPPYQTGGQRNGWGRGYTYGFRVPLLVVSAYTAPHTVDANPHDFGSLLDFIEHNFGLAHIGAGTYADAYADDLAGFFTLQTPRAFTTIPAKYNRDYFLHAPRSPEGPDDD
jgi:phospholipase C